MDTSIAILLVAVLATVILYRIITGSKKKRLIQLKLNEPFPEAWRETLKRFVLFYNRLDNPDRILFEKRICLFLLTKKIDGIDTEIDDTIRLFVASSAIIPTFAFPEYTYPHVHSILIYPNSFDEHFQTQRFSGHKEFISGMVGNRFMEGTVILSKPDLITDFDGLPHKGNVGIHEFVHLLDKEDGAIDGIPEVLLEHKFVGPWLHEIKNEMKKIQKRNSDIDPYALTSNAEFLAVVSEYFFDNPEKFQNRHPELFKFLSSIFRTKLKT